jgi:hypothetical protein
VGALDEQPRLLVDVADEERLVRVAVDSADVGGDVDVDDVAVRERPVVGDAVADDVVDAAAQGLGEAAIAERRRVGAVLDEELVPDPVEVIGGDAGRDDGLDGVERACGDPAGDPHCGDRLVGADHRAVVGEGCRLPDVLGRVDVIGNGSHSVILG